MKLRGLILSIIITTMATIASAHAPLYVVNGVVVESIEHIPHENIESIEMLPADEETVAKWGIEASEPRSPFCMSSSINLLHSSSETIPWNSPLISCCLA